MAPKAGWCHKLCTGEGREVVGERDGCGARRGGEGRRVGRRVVLGGSRREGVGAPVCVRWVMRMARVDWMEGV